MVPDLELQLAAAIKALREVVAPAVDPANGVALEQLHLATATVDFVRSRMEFRHGRIVRELANAADLAEQALAACDDAGIARLAGQARDQLATGRDEGEMDRLRAAIMEAVETAVATYPDNRALKQAVLGIAARQTDLARAWFAPMGFEVDPASRPVLEDLLRG